MDSPEVAFGICCTLVPVGIIAVIAWLARNKAEQALKQAEDAGRQVKVLQQQLVMMRLALNKFTSGSEVLPPAQAVTQIIVPPAPTPVARPEPIDEAPAPQPIAAPVFADEPPPPRVTPLPLPPRAPPPPARAPIEWEKWIGIRGAAVLGGIVFAMAGVYLFRYSVQQGWISPVIRVSAAMLAGIGALVAGQRLREKYQVTAQALSGGGVVVLYAATWASRAMYELIPTALAFVLMVLITAVAGVLAVRQHNRLVAWLGLVGGFATPLLLSTGQNAPIPLFAYVLMLDVGVLFVAMKTKWRSITALALTGTTLLELGWVFTRMESDQAWLAFGVLALFTLLFTVTMLRSETTPSNSTRWFLGAALFVPVLALAYFASNVDVSVPQWPTAGFLAVLTIGVGFIHRRSARGEAMLLMTATIASLFVLSLTAMTRRGQLELQWVLLGATLLVAAASVINTLLAQSEARRNEGLAAVRVFLAGATVVLLIGALRTPTGYSHLAFNVGLGVLTLAQGWVTRGSRWQSLAGVLPALWLGIDVLSSSGVSTYDDALLTFGPVVVLAALLLAMSLRFDLERLVIAFVIGSASWMVLLSDLSPRQPLQVLASMALLTALGLAAAVRGNRPIGALVLVLLYGVRLAAPLRVDEGMLVPWAAVLVAGFVAALAFHVVLTLAPARFHANRWGPLSAGLVLPAAFPGLLLAWRAAFGTSMQGALPVLLAMIAVGTATWARGNRPALAGRGVMWLLAGAATLVAIAVPLQLENQWVTISWALMGVAYLELWKRFDSRGLKWLAATLLSFVTIRLLVNDEVLHYGVSGGMPVLNWLTYTYLIPAAALVGAGWRLDPLEVSRARGWETPLYSFKLPLLASASFLSAALVVFAWVTLSVFDFYAPTSNLTLNMNRMPARDLTLSVSWIIYAVGLLAVGMWRNNRALRWVSLFFLLASIGKVFLYDLGELKDLYRVASLMGLAISLIGVSLAYQRFVFRRSEERPS